MLRGGLHLDDWADATDLGGAQDSVRWVAEGPRGTVVVPGPGENAAWQTFADAVIVARERRQREPGRYFVVLRVTTGEGTFEPVRFAVEDDGMRSIAATPGQVWRSPKGEPWRVRTVSDEAGTLERMRDERPTDRDRMTPGSAYYAPGTRIVLLDSDVFPDRPDRMMWETEAELVASWTEVER